MLRAPVYSRALQCIRLVFQRSMSSGGWSQLPGKGGDAKVGFLKDEKTRCGRLDVLLVLEEVILNFELESL